ncbi:MAG: hypothetical protein RL272_45 [Candidatus Parcubacteria bacterium]
MKISIDKRTGLLIAWCIALLLGFLVFSRFYPLFDELDKAIDGKTASRALGAITKSDLFSLVSSNTYWEKVWKTVLNWLYANRQGMTFGIAFGGSIAALLKAAGPSGAFLRRRGPAGAAIGAILGAPLGVCANCVVPIGVSMYRNGAGMAATLGAAVASPTMNFIGLLLLVLLFPVDVAVIRLGASLFLILVVVPWLSSGERPPAPETSPAQPRQESWGAAAKAALTGAVRETLLLAALTIPLMIAAAFLGSVLAIAFPMKSLGSLPMHPLAIAAIASVVGAILPMPMFSDMIFAYVFMKAGLAREAVVALLVALPSASILSALAFGAYVNRRAGFGLLAAVAAVAFAAAIAEHLVLRFI